MTEIFDDSGRPHTLEHLTFLGSKQCVMFDIRTHRRADLAVQIPVEGRIGQGGKSVSRKRYQRLD